MFSPIGSSSMGVTVASDVKNPMKVYVDEDAGPVVYVSLQFLNRVENWTKGASKGVQVGDEYSLCSGVSVDKEKNVYMFESNSHQVVNWSPRTNTGIYVTRDSRTVYVADMWNNRIQKWPKDAREAFTVTGNGTEGSDNATLDFPNDVFVDEKTNVVYNIEMIKIHLYLISFILWCYKGECAQPYFPSQIVFSPDNGVTTIAIDEINQRAYQKITLSSYASETSFVLKNFPYATPDSPQSKYYVQLLVDFPPLNCMYGTYWKYGGNTFNSFPSYWLNGSSFEIKNYMKFNYGMIHSKDSSVNEDYWYSNVTCKTDSGQTYPCEEIYFQKNTQIPLRSTRVARGGWDIRQFTTYYKTISVGKPDDKLFDSIPKNWSVACRDVMLGLLYYPQTSKIDLNQSSKIEVWLITPPHRINGNDTVRIQWKSKECYNCFKLSPEELYFSGVNFQERQILTITRVKNGPKTTLVPIFNGGGFDLITPDIYPIFIE
ncbi:unnamed protein product [Rotaria sp. Silwood2]|nr:unnamed protein product [Rotaria sp. Silwood2]